MIIKANFAAIKILSKTACFLTYKKEKTSVLRVLKVGILKKMGGILKVNRTAFVLSRGSLQQHDYRITVLFV